MRRNAMYNRRIARRAKSMSDLRMRCEARAEVWQKALEMILEDKK